MSKTSEINELAVLIEEFLRENNFHILKHKSRSSKSIYYKFDGGVAFSLRISDHPSPKKHLRYRYVLLTDREGFQEVNVKGLPSRIYGKDMLEELLTDLLKGRTMQKMKFNSLYNEYMQNGINDCAKHKNLRVFEDVTDG